MDRDAKFETAALGIQAEELKKHPAMQALLKRLQTKAEIARELLTEVDPEDTRQVRAKQTEVAIFKRMVAEIDEMIVEGHLCEAELEEEGESE